MIRKRMNQQRPFSINTTAYVSVSMSKLPAFD